MDKKWKVKHYNKVREFAGELCLARYLMSLEERIKELETLVPTKKDKSKSGILYCGKPIEQYSKDEIIKALKYFLGDK